MPCPTCGTEIAREDIILGGNRISVGWSNMVVQLSPSEFQIASMLVKAMPGYVTKEQMIHALYYADVLKEEPENAETTVHVHVFRIRRAIKPLSLTLSKHISDVGYRIYSGIITPVAARIRAHAR